MSLAATRRKSLKKKGRLKSGGLSFEHVFWNALLIYRQQHVLLL